MPPKTFNAKELEAKTDEVRICRYVAQEMNRRDATDYYAKDPGYYLENPDESIDVELFSESDRCPRYPIQVVTTPSNKHLELRSRIKNVETLRNRLASALAERGLQHYTVGISLGKEGLLRQIPQDAVTQCANLMVRNKLKEGAWSLDWREITEFSPTLHKFVRHIHAHPASGLTVRANRSAWTPSDERLIEESILMKEQKYPPALKSQTALVIGGSLFIDGEQVQSYIASGRAAAITFADVWIVFDNRAVLLKQRQPRLPVATL